MMQKELKDTPKLYKIKKEYVSPEIKITWIEMEQGFAASSATLNTGDTANVQQLETWEDQTPLGKDYDL